jgi:hypothetical protein
MFTHTGSLLEFAPYMVLCVPRSAGRAEFSCSTLLQWPEIEYGYSVSTVGELALRLREEPDTDIFVHDTMLFDVTQKADKHSPLVIPTAGDGCSFPEYDVRRYSINSMHLGIMTSLTMLLKYTIVFD